ncbi:major facilitator superfamily MFS_1 [Thermoclostridium stercorarium subsp. stercorarium DSM 8532]|uniref:Major facilitator superfamily MFS_1 n=2 Tax=Thermoclostridium stercorarium TaxID=1510 RepID=L7VPD9_THES1|nr:MFS transporter [Thermoclostridium stercorarium]AGC68622.1 major facilitator superfamily MFS_1 [Thermoclostridium stercorarium subsp. stercorarium DSM 8532]AGI39635.1 sodium-melibiose symporter [Thermoclostridium stercorarium subsp. stercorarium DSM 8532]ANW98966.1 MFS transporter [Thermoclostridium stercorarium subsp. thermolacticum DSM 2910]
MKLNYTRTVIIGLAFFSICAFWQLYDSIVPLILKNTFDIGDTVAGGIMAMDNILALFMLPFFGALSDRTSTKIGKRMPYIIGGTALAVAAMNFLPYGDNTLNFVLFVVALLITLLAMSTYRSPAVALMPDVTPKPLRSKANAIINLMGALGGAFTLVIISLLVPDVAKPDYSPLFLIVSGLMIVSVVVLFLIINENKLVAEMQETNGHGANVEETASVTGNALPKDVRRSLIFILLSIFFWFMAYNAVTTAFSKYAQTVLGIKGGGFASSLLVATAAAVVSYIPVGLIASKIGRKKTILIGITMMFVSFAAASFFTSYHPLITVFLALVGSGWAAINVNSYPMVVEMAKGSDVGKYTGYYYTFSMSAQILTPVLSGALLEHVGYRTLFPYAAVFMIMAFCTMLTVRHGDSKPLPPEEKLEMLDIGD